MGVIQYREAEHKLNPYLGKSETAKAHLAKRDPALAKFYERESNPVLLPLFGKNKDLTVSGKLVKDPFMSAIVKIAEQVHERWRTEDHQSAIAQRTAAEQALKRLESAA